MTFLNIFVGDLDFGFVLSEISHVPWTSLTTLDTYVLKISLEILALRDDLLIPVISTYQRDVNFPSPIKIHQKYRRPPMYI